jgi:hypothetical protein
MGLIVGLWLGYVITRGVYYIPIRKWENDCSPTRDQDWMV